MATEVVAVVVVVVLVVLVVVVVVVVCGLQVSAPRCGFWSASGRRQSLVL